MNMMDLRNKTPDELSRLRFELSKRDNYRAVKLIAEFEDYFNKTVTVVKGRKVPHGTTGVCFWMGVTSYAKYADPYGLYDSVRVGIRDKDGEVYWTALDNIELAKDQRPPESFAPAKSAKKYRVNESENFNLYSMYDHLKAMQIDMEDSGDYAGSDKVQARITEVEELMDKAPFVGSLVDWPTLKRIREIKEERQMIRYQRSLAAGDDESEAAYAFTL